MSEEFPKIPETADEMVVRWAQRDAEYAKQDPLDDAAIDAIIAGRQREASFLPVADRGRMWRRAETWRPWRQSFGSIKDWLS